MKVVKKLLKVLLWIVVTVLVVLLVSPLWLGPVVKGVANSVAPKMLGADFHLGRLSANPYTCRFEIGDLKVSNPEGYSEVHAATVGDVVFDAETASLLGDTIHIEELTVKDVFVSYVSGGKDDVNNFEQIQYNLAGGKDKYEAEQAKKAAEEREEKTEEEKPSKKVVIDKLTISGVKIKYGVVPISIPFDICLKDIGKEKDGATFSEVAEMIWTSIKNAAGNIGDLAGKAVGAVGDAAGKAAGAVGDAAGKAAGAVGDAAGKAAGAVGDAAGAVGGAVGDAAGKAADAVGDGAKAVGDGAKKALDSIKNLW